MKYNLFIIFILFSYNLFSLDIVIYENPPIFHSKSTLKKINENKANNIEIKKYDKSCDIQCMLSNSIYQSYLYYLEEKNGKLFLSIYETKTGNKIFNINKEYRPGNFASLVLKANTLIRVYAYDITDIFQAINKKNIKFLKFFAKNDLKELNGLKMSPLNYALYLKRYDLIEYLMKDKSLLYNKDKDGITPLHRIAEWGNLELFKKYYFSFLIDLKSNNNKTFLHYALSSGNIKLIKFLLKKGFSLEDETRTKRNALHFVAESGNIEAFDFVYEKNKKILDLTMNKQNILHFAAKSGNIELFNKIKLILKEKKFDFDKNQFDRFNKNYIFYSIYADKENYINEFLKEGYKFQDDKYGNTALHYAVINNKMNSIRDLLKLGFNPNKENKNKATPVLLAFRYLNTEDLKELIVDAKFTDIKDINGLNALHYAVLGNRFETVNYLIFNGVDIHSKGNFGENSLVFAILSKSKTLFMYLFFRGVSSDIKLENGDTLLHFASQEKDPWFFNFLIKNNIKIYLENNQNELPLDIAIKESNIDVLKSLSFKNKIEFYRPDKNNNKALEKSIIWNKKEVFKFFLKEKLRFDIPNINQECSLDIAIRLKRKYMISQLKKLGAPNCKR